jgi:hypothetical protein
MAAIIRAEHGVGKQKPRFLVGKSTSACVIQSTIS